VVGHADVAQVVRGAPVRVRVEGLVGGGQPIGVRRRIMCADSEPLQLGDSFYPLEIVGGTKMMRPADIVEGTDQVLEDLATHQRAMKTRSPGECPPPRRQQSFTSLRASRWVVFSGQPSTTMIGQ